MVQNLEEGQVSKGVVKNITDYGAFVDLGGIDGLLHVTDMAWRRVNHPSEILSIGQTVKVQIIRINQETHRISLGMKQLESDPWDGIGQVPGRQAHHRPRDQHHRLRCVRRAGAGHRRPDPRVGNVLDQEERASGQDRVHLQEVEVVVLEVDPNKRRISLGLKQTLENPWEAFAQSSLPAPKSKAKSRTRPSSVCSSASKAMSTAWFTCPTSTGTVRASRSSRSTTRATWSRPVVLDVDVDKERISLGIKQLGKRRDPAKQPLRRTAQGRCRDL
jgi:small subunit ribosomal protein S1